MRMLDVHVHYDGKLDDADRFVDAWRGGGIEKAVVFGMTQADCSNASVEEIATLVEKHPDFFIPFGYVAPGHHDGVAEVRKAAAAGFRGMKFIFPAKPYDDDEYLPIYEAAAEAGMVCLFHTGIVIGTARADHDCTYQRKWRVSSSYMRPARLDRIARCFPEMNIIGAHIGGSAWYEEATAMMRWNGNITFDLSIGQLHYRRKDAAEGEDARAIKPRMQELYDTGQLDLTKILFGTDGVVGTGRSNPKWALDTVQFELDAIGATDAEKEAVCHDTAAGILGVD